MRDDVSGAELHYDILTRRTYIRGNYHFQHALTDTELAEGLRDPSGHLPAKVADDVTRTVFDAVYGALARHRKAIQK